MSLNLVLGRLNAHIAATASKSTTPSLNLSRLYLKKQQFHFQRTNSTLYQNEVANKEEGNLNKARKGEKDSSDDSKFGLDLKNVRVGFNLNMDKNLLGKYIPEGLNQRLRKEASSYNERLTTIGRAQLLDAVKYLQEGQQRSFLPSDDKKDFLLLDGPAGSGKSVILSQLVYWARSNGWLVVYIPDAFDFTGGSYIEESQREPGMYDQPEMGTQFCQKLYAAHSAQLKQIPLKTKVSVGTFQPSSTVLLSDLVLYGSNPENARYSCDVVHHIRRELNLVTEFPVLIAIDGVNSFWANSKSFGDPKSNKRFHLDRLPAKKLVLAKEFMNFMNHGLVNGTTVAAISRTQHGVPALLKRVTDTKAADSVKDVPLFDLTETNQLLDTFLSQEIIFTDLTEETRTFIWMVTGGRGTDLARYCRTL